MAFILRRLQDLQVRHHLQDNVMFVVYTIDMNLLLVPNLYLLQDFLWW